MSMIKMVSSGTVTGDVYCSGCSFMELKELCVIVNTYVQSTDKGQFEFRDENDNKALVSGYQRRMLSVSMFCGALQSECPS